MCSTFERVVTVFFLPNQNLSICQVRYSSYFIPHSCYCSSLPLYSENFLKSFEQILSRVSGYCYVLCFVKVLGLSIYDRHLLLSFQLLCSYFYWSTTGTFRDHIEMSVYSIDFYKFDHLLNVHSLRVNENKVKHYTACV